MADCQGRLTSFLWERHVFEPRATETIVMVARAPNTAKRRTAHLAGATAALVASLFSLGLALHYPAEVAGWTEALTHKVAPIAARFGSITNP